MKVILRKDIKGLGSAGEIKDVKPGYARNYLIPKAFAVLATEENLYKLQLEKEKIEKQKEKEKQHLAELINELTKKSISINAKVGETGKLFGVITKEDIADRIKQQTGVEISKYDILLEEPIKETGIYSVEIKVRSEKFSEIVQTGTVKVWIVGE